MPRRTPPRSERRHEHWEGIYRSSPAEELSWTQTSPAVSRRLIRAFAPPEARIVDVGGGASPLAALLAAGGSRHVAVVDISATALRRGRALERPGAPPVRRRTADILEVRRLGPVDVWHDRAVFHFLTQRSDRRRYAELVQRSVVPGGHAVIATFAPDGPPRCSGLPVRRYDPRGLAAEFSPDFVVKRTVREAHTTPWGVVQPFTYVVVERVGARPRAAPRGPRRPKRKARR